MVCFRMKVYQSLIIHGYPHTRSARLINRFKNLLVSCAKLKIGKTLFSPPDSLDKVVHLEHLHIKVAQSAAGEIKAKESRILRNLRPAIDGGEAAVALCFSHSKDLKLIKSFAV